MYTLNTTTVSLLPCTKTVGSSLHQITVYNCKVLSILIRGLPWSWAFSSLGDITIELWHTWKQTKCKALICLRSECSEIYSKLNEVDDGHHLRTTPFIYWSFRPNKYLK